jgi:hypothetical protein
MSEVLKFPNIDTTYWKTNDPTWMAERKAAWPRIEGMLKGVKDGKGKTAIKHYFLKGKMPDWDKFADWDNTDRHVDIFMFLWLHPSWDEALLSRLREEYISSELIVYDDLRAGFGKFLSWGTVRACQDYSRNSEEEKRYILHTDGHNELLFRVLMGDLNRTDYEIARPVTFGPKQIYHIPQCDFINIRAMGRWLCIKEMHAINNDMLFQYDLPLEWWYRGCTKNEDYFTTSTLKQRQKPSAEKALWRIHNFDTVKEGDTPRTRFVHKMRTILDERPFIKDVEDMWRRVKAGKVTVEDPWVE